MSENIYLPDVDYAYLEDLLSRLLNTASPTGHAEEAIILLEDAFAHFPEVRLERTKKGALLATLPGKKSGPGALKGLTAHVDTLGAMVRVIKPNGRLELSPIGGFAWASVEGEGCQVHTRKNGPIRGSLMPVKASVHVYNDASREDKRTSANMEVRLDEVVKTLKRPARWASK